MHYHHHNHHHHNNNELFQHPPQVQPPAPPHVSQATPQTPTTSATTFTFNRENLGDIYILSAAELTLDCKQAGFTYHEFPAFYEATAAIERNGLLNYYNESMVIGIDVFHCTANLNDDCILGCVGDECTRCVDANCSCAVNMPGEELTDLNVPAAD